MFLIIAAIVAFLAWCLVASWLRILQVLTLLVCLPFAVVAIITTGAWLLGRFIGLVAAVAR